MPTFRCDVLIVGAGPTGLGAARRAQELDANWLLLEATDHVGGLAASFRDDRGFTWDQGAHVEFSHYDLFSALGNDILGEDGWLTHQRRSIVRLGDDWIPYPVQNNLHRLPAAARWACVRDLVRARTQSADVPAGADNFATWSMATFGEAFCELFLWPYSKKVWGYSPDELSRNWVKERVAVPKLETVLRSICTGEDYGDWGPNRQFRYPKEGGIGALWTGVARRLSPDRVLLGQSLTKLELARHRASFGDLTIEYDSLVSTVPLDVLTRMAAPQLWDKARSVFRRTASDLIGLGIDEPLPDTLRGQAWVYVTDPSIPFHRVSVMSNYSPAMVPRPDAQYSIVIERSRGTEPPDPAWEGQVWAGLQQLQLVSPNTHPISVWTKQLSHGYPTPFLGRDAVIRPLLEMFEQHGVLSRGRFGTWMYEVSNQDHSFMQGVEALDFVVNGTEEFTIYNSDRVNAGTVLPFPASAAAVVTK